MNKFRVGLRVLAELGLYGIIGHIEEAIKLLSTTLNNITSADMVCILFTCSLSNPCSLMFGGGGGGGGSKSLSLLRLWV